MLADLTHVPPDVLARRRVVGTSMSSLRTLVSAELHGVDPPSATLQSRFVRAGLPSVRQYLATARLLHASRAERWISSSRLSRELRYSSPQSFGRTVRLLTGMPVSVWRETAAKGYPVLWVQRFVTDQRDRLLQHPRLLDPAPPRGVR